MHSQTNNKYFTMERNFIAEINHIDTNAEITIAELMDNNTIEELIFAEPKEISFYNNDNVLVTEKAISIRCGVHSLDDIVFETESGRMVSSDALVCGTMAYFATHIIENEIRSFKERVEEQKELVDSEPTYTNRVFFLPDAFYKYGMEDEDFASLSFMYGNVMTLDEYQRKFNNGNLQDIHPDKGFMKILEFTDDCVEMCPHCGYEVVLKTEFKIQTCPICGKRIAPCNLCGGNCTNDCPIKANKL